MTTAQPGTTPRAAVTVRRARAADAGAVAALYAQLVANPALHVLPARLDELAAHADAALLVASVDGTLVGTVFVAWCPDAMFGRRPFAVVENIVVDTGSRGRGVGAALLAEVERLSRARDCSKIMLLSASERVAAHRFFVRGGYAGDRKRGFVKYRSAFASAD
ncbi:MAG TPA: GNAT family N-acetyltransferase [Burkholderiaceae bacterium]